MKNFGSSYLTKFDTQIMTWIFILFYLTKYVLIE